MTSRESGAAPETEREREALDTEVEKALDTLAAFIASTLEGSGKRRARAAEALKLVRAALGATARMVVLSPPDQRRREAFTAAIMGDGEPLPDPGVIQILRGALADIAFSDDMTLKLARAKAARIYRSTDPEHGGGECSGE